MGFLDPKPVTANMIATQAADPESPIGSAVVGATNSALETAGMASTVDLAAEDDVAYGLVGDDEKRNFVEWTTDGTPTASSQALLSGAIRSESGIDLPEADLRDVAGGISTEDGRELLWFRNDGTLTDYSRRRTQNALKYPKPYIASWNDSFGSGVYITLAALTGMTVREHTEGGQTSPRIAARQGGVRALFTVTGNTIPATGAVTIASWSANPIRGATSTPRMGYIGGVKGTLTYTADAGDPNNEYAGTMTFTRVGTGPVVTVPNPVEFICVEEQYTDGHGVLMPFTNDRLGLPIHKTVANVQAMVERFESQVTRVVVMGSFPAADMTHGTALRDDFDARRNAVKDAVRGQWLDPFLDYFMTDQVFTDMGLTMTADDITDRNNGLVPRQLRSDSIHLTQAAKDKLALYIATAFKDRGWIKTINA